MAHLFSNKLKDWLESPGQKTYAEIQHVFAQKSFAVVFILLMITAALPLPTGGITHIFEIITMLLAVELIIGRRSLWFPNWWKKRAINPVLANKALPKLVGFIKWFEKRSHPRLSHIYSNNLFLRLIGLLVLILAFASLIAIPFSGLDTMPAMGVVIVSLSLILEDILLLIIGLVIGGAGIILELALGKIALHFLG